MKYLLPIIIVATIYWAPLYPVYAKDSSNSGRIKIKFEHESTGEGSIFRKKEFDIRKHDASAEAEFHQKLKTIKDQHKAGLLEQITKNLNLINKRRTDQMTKQVNRMSEILTKVQTIESTQSGDLTSKKSALDLANSSIEAAKNGITLQSQKTDSINITGDNNLGTDAKNARNSLMNDLKGVETLVKKAKTDLISAYKMVKGS